MHDVGYWGPVTSTIDWCEHNYQFSFYVAEMANTFSNLGTVFFALYGFIRAIEEGLPPRYLAAFFSVFIVGIGSMAFHGTLLYEAQLADELPMIMVTSQVLYMQFEILPGPRQKSSRRYPLAALVIGFNVAFAYAYYYHRDPVFHQIVFATLMISTALRTNYLLRHKESGLSPSTVSTAGRMYMLGCGIFILGFVIWNLDNIFCERITVWKRTIGWPLAFLLEGHSWWHLLTGLGSYLMIVGVIYTTLCTREGDGRFVIDYTAGGWLPHVRRVYPSLFESDYKSENEQFVDAYTRGWLPHAHRAPYRKASES